MDSRKKALNEKLLSACYSNDANNIKLTIEEGADVNVQDEWGGITPLHFAARDGNLAVVKFLIEKGADFKIVNTLGNTPLSDAVSKGYLEVVKFLIEKGANPYAINSWRETLLHIAVEHGHLTVVQFLIEKGARINAINNNGMTLLHLAAEFGELEVVKLLIKNGANIYAKNKKNKIPKEITRNQNVMTYLTNLYNAITKLFSASLDKNEKNNFFQELKSLSKTYFPTGVSDAFLQMLINKAILEKRHSKDEKEKLRLQEIVASLLELKSNLSPFKRLTVDIRKMSDSMTVNFLPLTTCLSTLFNKPQIISARCPSILKLNYEL